MADGTDPLRAEIERAREDLARDVRELRVAAKEFGRRVAMALGAAVAAYVAFRLVRGIWRRVRD